MKGGRHQNYFVSRCKAVFIFSSPVRRQTPQSPQVVVLRALSIGDGIEGCPLIQCRDEEDLESSYWSNVGTRRYQEVPLV